MQPVNRYIATFKGDVPTRLAPEPTGGKIDVKKGQSVNVHAAVAAQLRGTRDWTIETAEMGEQTEEETERKRLAKEENDKREAELKEQVRKDAEKKRLEEQKEAEARAKAAKDGPVEPQDADTVEEEKDEEDEDDEKHERKGKVVKSVKEKPKKGRK